jgi:hypothetical protein
MLRNITLSADELLINLAREKAQAQHSTLNEQFRVWLAQYVHDGDAAQQFDALLQDLAHVRAGKRFTRDELNERR